MEVLFGFRDLFADLVWDTDGDTVGGPSCRGGINNVIGWGAARVAKVARDGDTSVREESEVRL